MQRPPDEKPVTQKECAPGERMTFIRFQVSRSLFAIPLCLVIEIAEFTEAVQYPEAHESCLGIINLRGHIIPILPLAQGGDAPSGPQRVLVVEFNVGQRFGFIVEKPKKIEVNSDEVRPDSPVLLIQGEPVRILTPRDFEILTTHDERAA